MSYDEYWRGLPRLAEDYYKAHLLKIEERNQELWLQGLYFYEAITTSLNNGFGKKGSKKFTYRDKPIRITPLTEQEKRLEAAKERKKVIDSLTAWGSWFNKKKGKENG